MAITEDSPITLVTDKVAAALLEKNKGIHTVGDLLELVPRGYLDPGQVTDLSHLVEGEMTVVVARIARATTRPMKNKPRQKMLTAVITDGARELDLTFFKAWGHEGKLVPGHLGVFAGTVTRFNHRWQLTHPEYEVMGDELDEEAVVRKFADRQIPIYSATGKVTSFKMRKVIDAVLDQVKEVREPLPPEVRERRGLVGRSEAIELIHRPHLRDDPGVGFRRLRYDEAFVLQTILAQRRAAVESLEATSRVARPGGLLAAFDDRLPFELTAGQREIGELLESELAAHRPMHRLLQGEVGSGKTVIALRAMLAVVDAGGQAALLAPTEVLAGQHHRSITALLGDLAEGGMLGGSDIGTHVALLTGGQSAATRRQALNEAVTGDAGIVIGTHALIQKHVAFLDLALVVVDEQHRFGVEQRDALREKSATPPHLLVMTATPIPRTVAMTVFGDMETSTLRELPRGRAPIETHIVDSFKPAWVERTWSRIAEEVTKGHQAYVVCPKIGDSEDATGGDAAGGAASGDDNDIEWFDEDVGGPGDPGDEPPGDATTHPERRPPKELTGVYPLAELLATEPVLKDLRMEVLHGRLDSDEKDRVMRAFAAGTIDVLISTTVIEVGVDVANASVMVVMDADRFGISQLHQLRGRVGRGGVPGLCLLMTDAEPDTAARERLEAVESTTDGFVLARRDLQLRREGDVLGARQSGRSSSVRFLRMGNRDDEQLIAEAREDATGVIAADPTLTDHPQLAARVAMRLDEEQAAYLERG